MRCSFIHWSEPARANGQWLSAWFVTTLAQLELPHIAELVEAKQRVVAGADEMSVVSSACLLAAGLAHGTVHVQD